LQLIFWVRVFTIRVVNLPIVITGTVFLKPATCGGGKISRKHPTPKHISSRDADHNSVFGQSPREVSIDESISAYKPYRVYRQIDFYRSIKEV